MIHSLAVTSGSAIVKVPLVLPAGIVTFGGVTTFPSRLPLIETVAPPAGAGPLRVTVPVVVPPPTTLAEATPTVASVGGAAGEPTGISVSTVCGARYPSFAVPVSIAIGVAPATADVAIAKLAD